MIMIRTRDVKSRKTIRADYDLGHPLSDALRPEGGGVVESEIGVAGGGEGGISHRRHIRSIPQIKQQIV